MIVDDFIRTMIGYKKIEALNFDVEPDMYHEDEKVLVATIALTEDELK